MWDIIDQVINLLSAWNMLETLLYQSVVHTATPGLYLTWEAVN